MIKALETSEFLTLGKGIRKGSPIRHVSIKYLQKAKIDLMTNEELLTEAEIHAFGIQILFKKLEEDGWIIESADPEADRATHPQIIAHKDGEIGFFVIRTAMYPYKGRIEGEEVFQTQVRHAQKHGADCYFASIGIASAAGESEEEMSKPLKDAGFNVTFEGLVKMALPPENGNN